MAEVTEIATITLKDGYDMSIKGTEAYEIWQETIAKVADNKGFTGLSYGNTLEKPEILQLIVHWDSIESHQKFIATPGYGPFVSHLTKMTSDLQLIHFTPAPVAPAVLDSGIAEMATFFEVDDYFNDNVGKFVPCLEGAEGYLGSAHGPVLEEVSKEEGGVRGKAVVLCIGWESKEKHMAFRGTEAFKTHIHLLREGTKAVEMHHTNFVKY